VVAAHLKRITVTLHKLKRLASEEADRETHAHHRYSLRRAR